MFVPIPLYIALFRHTSYYGLTLYYSVHKGARGFVTSARNICMIVFNVMPGARNVCMGVLSFMSGAFSLNGRVKFYPFRTGA